MLAAVDFGDYEKNKKYLCPCEDEHPPWGNFARGYQKAKFKAQTFPGRAYGMCVVEGIEG